MFKAKDLVIGEILESDNLKILLDILNERFQEYKKQDIKVSYYYAKGIRFLVKK